MPKKGENVYHRKDGLWEARYVKSIDAFGQKKYGSVYARTCREVKEKRQAVVDNIRLNQTQPITRNTDLSQLVNEWLIVNKNRLKPSTYQKYCGFARNHIECHIGKLPVIYLTTASINQFIQERLNGGVSPQTANAVLIFIHSCLKYGHRQYGLPLPDIVYIKLSKKEMRVFTKEEQKRLVEYLQNDIDVYKFGVLLALYTGLRIGELCALEWNDVEGNRIKVRRTVQRIQSGGMHKTELNIGPPKTKTSMREIPIPSFMCDIIKDFREKGSDEQYLLGNSKVHLVEPRVMQYRFKKYLKDLNIRGATFHTLRHTFATRCVECEFEIKSLSEVLGHSNVNTTLSKYVHSSFELKASNMEKLLSAI